MADPRQLRRPPITEALVDFRIIADAAVDAERLRPLIDDLRSRFPKSDERKQFRSEFRVEAGKLLPPVAQDLGFHGLWLTSDDGTRIAQFRPDGFTFNNVGPYMGGDALIDEALSLWSRYIQIARPAVVTRLALRYLNRLDLPLNDGDEFSRFLVAAPELPPGAPQNVSGFVSRVVAHDETGATAAVTQKLDSPARPVPVIIDVDVFFPMELDIQAETLRGFLEMLRLLKNRCFFAMLTDEAVNLYI
jgi:uncharacterized protein (TIGR04255 family)